MACGGCSQRREQIGIAINAVAHGDVTTAAANLTDVARTMKDDANSLARAAGQRLSAAHARLKR